MYAQYKLSKRNAEAQKDYNRIPNCQFDQEIVIDG